MGLAELLANLRHLRLIYNGGIACHIQTTLGGQGQAVPVKDSEEALVS